MKTVFTTSAEEAAAFIKKGGLVAFPTETVYGLGAAVTDEAAVARIFAAKRRPADNPLIAHVSDISQIAGLTAEITASAERFIAAFFPGPLTIVLRKSSIVPMMATAGLETIGVRMPRPDLARRFIAAAGTAVAAPSANLSGRPSPTTWQAVAEDLDGRIDCILQGDATEIGLESTVVDCTSSVPLVLRTGSVSLNELQAVVPETEFLEITGSDPPRSPGLRHRHYSPRASVIAADPSIISQQSGTAFIGITRPRVRFELEYICTDVREYAHALFEFFRECDRRGIETIYCEPVRDEGLGKALMDRIRRAADG